MVRISSLFLFVFVFLMLGNCAAPCQKDEFYCPDLKVCCKNTDQCGNFTCIPVGKKECASLKCDHAKEDCAGDKYKDAYKICSKEEECCTASYDTPSGEVVNKPFCVPFGVSNCLFLWNELKKKMNFCYCPGNTEYDEITKKCFPLVIKKCSTLTTKYCGAAQFCYEKKGQDNTVEEVSCCERVTCDTPSKCICEGAKAPPKEAMDIVCLENENQTGSQCPVANTFVCGNVCCELSDGCQVINIKGTAVSCCIPPALKNFDFSQAEICQQFCCPAGFYCHPDYKVCTCAKCKICEHPVTHKVAVCLEKQECQKGICVNEGFVACKNDNPCDINQGEQCGPNTQKCLKPGETECKVGASYIICAASQKCAPYFAVCSEKEECQQQDGKYIFCEINQRCDSRLKQCVLKTDITCTLSDNTTIVCNGDDTCPNKADTCVPKNHHECSYDLPYSTKYIVCQDTQKCSAVKQGCIDENEEECGRAICTKDEKCVQAKDDQSVYNKCCPKNQPLYCPKLDICCESDATCGAQGCVPKNMQECKTASWVPRQLCKKEESCCELKDDTMKCVPFGVNACSYLPSGGSYKFCYCPAGYEFGYWSTDWCFPLGDLASRTCKYDSNKYCDSGYQCLSKINSDGSISNMCCTCPYEANCQANTPGCTTSPVKTATMAPICP